MASKKTSSDLFSPPFWRFAWVGIAAAIVVAALPALLTQRKLSFVDFTQTGPIGDTIGGIMGPFVGIVAAALTFLAFWVQYKANLKQAEALADQQAFNKAQTEAAEEQIKTMQIERFESQFFSMLETHRNNVNETEVYYALESADRSDLRAFVFRGRHAFNLMAFEFRQLHRMFVIPNANKLKSKDKEYPKNSDLAQSVCNETAFAIFYYGLTIASNKLKPSYFPHSYDTIFRRTCEDLRKYRQALTKLDTGSEAITTGAFFAEDLHYEPGGRFVMAVPTAGHSYVLSHYFRHLYSIIEYIDQVDYNVLSGEKKRRYAMMLRSQLSIPEQHLLYYYSLSKVGRRWIDQGYLRKYSLVKNIIFPIVEFYKFPPKALGISDAESADYFAWSAQEDTL